MAFTDFLRRLLGDSNDAEVKRIMKTVALVEELAPATAALSEGDLRAKTDVLKRRLTQGETLDDLLPEAFAVVREASVRAIGQTPFPTQVAGGIVLHQGRIAEMKTGEGKTLTAAMPAYLNALAGKGVHIVTVNDYLARFQGVWMSKIFSMLGMSVGVILHDLDNTARRAAYEADITYVTNNELGFDYLRDNMVVHKNDMVQRGQVYAIVDEVDSILVDEARTPLIISGAGEASTELYDQADRFVQRLREGRDEKEIEQHVQAQARNGVNVSEADANQMRGDFVKDEKKRAITLTEAGVRKAEAFFKIENLSDMENTEINHHITQALKANNLMKRDDDYVVKDGQVIIVDEFTGRLMLGRRYNEGLHQAIEAKEHVKIENENKTLATITFQNYFRMYDKLAGMTGTAKTEEEEFRGIYKLDVVQIPTYRPMIRRDEDDRIYRKESGKFAAVIEEVIACHAKGQPVLVGTVSVEKSEILSRMLERRGVQHTVLNAKHHEREAEIVAQAGKEGAVTIATNMAGRGTDIILGGNPELLAKRRMRGDGYDEAVIEEAAGHDENAPEEVLEARKVYHATLAEYKRETDAEHQRVVALGGLHIIGTERHESRRIDNQLRGRSGRQGDPGSSRFYIALEDDLMRLFGGDRAAGLIERMGLQEDQSIEYGLLSKQIENAQKRVESRNYDMRKHVLQYDDVMNLQRTTIYKQRRQILEGENMRENVFDMVDKAIDDAIGRYLAAHEADEWDVEGLDAYLATLCLAKGDVLAVAADADEEKDVFAPALKARARAIYAGREEEARKAGADMRDVERVIILRVVDTHWMEQIDAMDQLRQGISLRAYAQRDPIVAYKLEGFDMFEAMIASIREETLRTLFHLRFEKPVERKQVAKPLRTNLDDAPAKKAAARPGVAGAAAPKIGRNDPCPCGSGKKYKHCHGSGG